MGSISSWRVVILYESRPWNETLNVPIRVTKSSLLASFAIQTSCWQLESKPSDMIDAQHVHFSLKYFMLYHFTPVIVASICPFVSGRKAIGLLAASRCERNSARSLHWSCVEQSIVLVYQNQSSPLFVAQKDPYFLNPLRLLPNTAKIHFFIAISRLYFSSYTYIYLDISSHFFLFNPFHNTSPSRN